jgi:hypothetical protein
MAGFLPLIWLLENEVSAAMHPVIFTECLEEAILNAIGISGTIRLRSASI